MNTRLPVWGISIVILVVTGCSAAPTDEQQSSSSSAEKKASSPPEDSPDEKGSSTGSSSSSSSSSCGNYEAKQCDPYRVIDYVKEHSDDVLKKAVGCGECAVTLTAAGLVAVGAVEAPPLAITAGAVWTAVKTSANCMQCLKMVKDSGLTESLSCVVAPCEYSVEGNQKDCEQSAPEGQYGFKNKGNFLCSYTTDPVEAECRMTCYDGMHIVKEADGWCWCKSE